jgi:lysophospholipase L1-like esterase
MIANIKQSMGSLPVLPNECGRRNTRSARMSTLRSARFSLSSVIGLCAACAVSATALPPVRIMPLGDSITLGTTAGGYRAPLYASLTNLGYTVDYVGTQTGNGAASLPDSDHEGHSGWRIGQLSAAVLGFLNSVAAPNVVLLHIGTNDANDGDFANAVNRLDALITLIATNRPYAHIIVTSLLPRTEPAINTSITNLFNPYVPGVVAAQVALGRRVTYLDMHAYLTTNDLADIAHPNQAGYNKMAAAWLPAITNLVAPSGDLEPPALVSARSLANNRQVAVTFSKPVTLPAASNLANYALSGGLVITGASLDASQITVTLSTSLQAPQTSYTVTVNNVTDGSSRPRSRFRAIAKPPF